MDVVEKEQLHHFSHIHPLSLVHLLQPNNKNENSDDENSNDENENEDEVNFVEEDHHGGQCNMCNEQIWSFHLCYYYCKSCNYSLHKFCAELPMTQENHPLHPGHSLTLSRQVQSSDLFLFKHTNIEGWKCSVCNRMWKNIYNYHCSICNFNMDIICATLSEQKINHPSHPHRLERMSSPIVSSCLACGNKHEGDFFQCTTCPTFRISLSCALLPAKLLIQNHTDGTFTHSHPLTLAYSSPFSERESKYYPLCRVCNVSFYSHLWIYKCDKCLYYVHVDCATSNREPFMSIVLRASLGKTSKKFKEDEHPNLLHCPFKDEGDNLLKHHMSNHKEFISKVKDGEMLNHSSHQHPLILFDKQTLVGKKSVSLHDPMKRIQLLCDGCVRPIMAVPFYMCCQYFDGQCNFVLHEWCAKLPPQVQGYGSRHEHTLFLIPKIPSKFFGVFQCRICLLLSNGFAYGCSMCEFYVDVNCAFIPEEITHDAHPGHLLSKVKPSTNLSKIYCKACLFGMDKRLVFHCPFCDFYIHADCALLMPRVIKHKCDKHPLSLRYEPAENHISGYFCEICEDELDPWKWFYHCTICAQSMHAACGPLVLQCEQATYANEEGCVYTFLNVKFGGTLEMESCHKHRLTFVQGLETDGRCSRCYMKLQYKMIFKCLECEFAIDYDCVSSMVNPSEESD